LALASVNAIVKSDLAMDCDFWEHQLFALLFSLLQNAPAYTVAISEFSSELKELRWLLHVKCCELSL
jgi:hypothetical protein